jgi:uncharacterized protein
MRLTAASILFLASFVLPASFSSAAEPEPADTTFEGLQLQFDVHGEAAAEGELEAQYDEACTLGYAPACLHRTWADGPSLASAAKAFSGACDAGEPAACTVVAWSIADGAMSSSAPQKDWLQAARMYRSACDDRFQPACYGYADLVFDGRGTTPAPSFSVTRWQQSCSAGHAASCARLALLYESGAEGVSQSTYHADRYGEKSCKLGQLSGCAALGRLRGVDKEAHAMDEWYGRLCDAGHRESCWTLAEFYVGENPEPLEGRRTDLLKMGCDQQHGASCAALADTLVSSDPSAAFALYSSGCTLGDPHGCAAVTDLVVQGAVSTTVSEATHAFETTCMHTDNLGACTELAISLLEASDARRDPVRAKQLLERVCTNPASDGKACGWLGRAFEEGWGTDRDRTTAARYFKWSCDEGVPASCLSRGTLLATGVGVRRDDAAALEMFEAACTGMASTGCYEAARLLDNGTHLPRDLRRSASMYERACAGDIGDACTGAGRLIEETSEDFGSARAWYEDGMDKGSLDAKRQLARLLWNKLGGERDRARAKVLCQEACQAGDNVACRGPSFL